MSKLKKSTIHAFIKAHGPKREVNSPKKGPRLILRSITPEALAYITSYLNNHQKAIVEACEVSLQEINENPDSYYQQHRYDLRVIKNAIEKLKKSTIPTIEKKDNELVYTYYCESCLGVHKINEECPKRRDRKVEKNG